MAEASLNSPAIPPFKHKKPATNCFCFVTIPVTDKSRAQDFYSAVFDWTFWTAPGSPVTVFHQGGEVMGTLSMRSDNVPGENSDGVTLYTLVDDVEASLKSIVEAGGTVEKEKWAEGGHTELGLYRDTEGNLGGVLKWLIN